MPTNEKEIVVPEVDLKDVLAHCRKDPDLAEELKAITETLRVLKAEEKRLLDVLSNTTDQITKHKFSELLVEHNLANALEAMKANLKTFVSKNATKAGFMLKVSDQHDWGDAFSEAKALQNAYIDVIHQHLSEQMLEAQAQAAAQQIDAGKQYATKKSLILVADRLLQNILLAAKAPEEKFQQEIGDIVNNLFIIVDNKGSFSREEQAQNLKELNAHLNDLLKNHKTAKIDLEPAIELIQLLARHYSRHEELLEKLIEFKDKVSKKLPTFPARIDRASHESQFQFPTTNSLAEAKRAVTPVATVLNEENAQQFEAIKKQMTQALMGASVIDSKHALAAMLTPHMGIRESEAKQILGILNVLRNPATGNAHIARLHQAIESIPSSSHDELRDVVEKYIQQNLVGVKDQAALLSAINRFFAFPEAKQLDAVNKQLDNMEVKVAETELKQAAKVETILLDHLRANILHAAKSFFEPVEQKGLFKHFKKAAHSLHHRDASAEQKVVVDFIRELGAGNLTFKEAVGKLKTFLEDPPGEWHKNSFASKLMAILYNTGEPKGLLQLSAKDTYRPIETIYGNYPPDPALFAANRQVDLLAYIKGGATAKAEFGLPKQAAVEGLMQKHMTSADRLKPDAKIQLKNDAVAKLESLAEILAPAPVKKVHHTSVRGQPK